MSTRKKKGDYVVHDKYFLEAKKLGYRARSAFKLLEIQERFSLVKPGMRVFDLASAPGSFLQVLSRIVGPDGIVVGMDIQKIEPLGKQNIRFFQGDVFDREGVARATEETFGWFRTRKKRAESGKSASGPDGTTVDASLPEGSEFRLKSEESAEESSAANEPYSSVRRERSEDSVKESDGFRAEFDVMTSDIAPATTGMTGVDQYRSIELNLAILDIADTFLKKGGNLLLKVFVGEDVDELVGPVKARYSKLHRIKPRACRDRSFEEYFVCMGKK